VQEDDGEHEHDDHHREHPAEGRVEGAGPDAGSPFGDFGTARHPAHPARFARALVAGHVPSREGSGTL